MIMPCKENKLWRRSFWGFHGSDDWKWGPLVCDAVQCCGRLPTFWRILLSQSFGFWQRVVTW